MPSERALMYRSSPCGSRALAAARLQRPQPTTIDSNQSHPLFEGDHFNGLSVWRAVFEETTGTATDASTPSAG
jgi:hypothetical protein